MSENQGARQAHMAVRCLVMFASVTSALPPVHHRFNGKTLDEGSSDVAYAELSALKADYAALKADHSALQADYSAMRAKLEASEASSGTRVETQAEPQSSASSTVSSCTIADFLPLEEHISPMTNFSELDAAVAARLADMDKVGMQRMVVSWHGSVTFLDEYKAFLDEFKANIEPLEDDASANLYNRSDVSGAARNMRLMNTQMAAYVAKGNGRLSGMCSISMSLDAKTTINEIQWCQAQGMPGIMIYGPQVMENADGSITYDYYYKNVSKQGSNYDLRKPGPAPP